ncbi:hypothetical protein MA16_Dca013512 [Dendrobium catenatum]|uniref:60S ribosome subunit biogenesis protein NIP7 pre-PUA domain-containing protein n=1 Tax=Dendrobium catenatum TaxID=906689 RepID=A0A2I0W479_9ASPA|nr:hypothetical protein MA16_Dca013512 [Dendrobium catenatum]
MWPLDENETKTVFEKLFNFTGPNLKHIVELLATKGPDEAPGHYCFHLHKNCVYYMNESIIRHATKISHDRSLHRHLYRKVPQLQLFPSNDSISQIS